MPRGNWKPGHGMAKTPEYYSWGNMISRCTNPKLVNYSDYGGRGITVCHRWKESFLDFLADMGPKPDGYFLDRINNDGNYEPNNCRWATREQSMANRRSYAPRLKERYLPAGSLEWL